MTWVSYAQFLEDIHLMRALVGVHHEEGFYIDVGAWDPEFDSVTKLFYDAGWRGVNVEPSPSCFRRLAEQRPRDINLSVVVAETTGKVAFYDDEQGQLGTTVEKIVDVHQSEGRMQKHATIVEAVTLTDICDRYAPEQIHFLKIDVEGAEFSVLKGMNFKKYRPWILCIESHFPNRPDQQTYDEWESHVLGQRYDFVYTDLINRYYVAEEHGDRAKAFAVPIDFYIPAKDVRHVARLEERIRELEDKLASIGKIVGG